MRSVTENNSSVRLTGKSFPHPGFAGTPSRHVRGWETGSADRRKTAVALPCSRSVCPPCASVPNPARNLLPAMRRNRVAFDPMRTASIE